MLILSLQYFNKLKNSIKVPPHTATVITNCTNRKRSGTGQPISAHQLSTEDFGAFTNAWLARINKAAPKFEAADLYVGRSFNDANTVTKHLGGKLYVVSAGIGLIHSSKAIPPYNLTVSSGAASINARLCKLGATVQDWWQSINQGNTNAIANLVNTSSSGPVLIALPANYIHMISEDLTRIATEQIDRLRIFTSTAGLNELPTTLKNNALPYDERLEGSPFPGTRTDFAQRAMRHFVFELEAHELPLPEAKLRVERALSTFFIPVIPKRTKITDSQIESLIRKHWHRLDGNVSQLLRCLRDDELVACEQGRFSSICRSVRESYL